MKDETKRTLVKMTVEQAQNTPSEIVANVFGGKFQITKTYIPYDYEQATECYFIDYIDGNDSKSCGSVYSLTEAMARIEELMK